MKVTISNPAMDDVRFRWLTERIRETPHAFLYRGANGNLPVVCCLLCGERETFAAHRTGLAYKERVPFGDDGLMRVPPQPPRFPVRDVSLTVTTSELRFLYHALTAYRCADEEVANMRLTVGITLDAVLDEEKERRRS